MAGVSIFKDVPLVPTDHVFHVNQKYNDDKNPNKVNLGIGGDFSLLFRKWGSKSWSRESTNLAILIIYARFLSFSFTILAFRDNDGNPMVLPVVAKVEKQLAEEIANKTLNHEYLSIDGLGSFCQAACKLLLGEDSPALAENRVCLTSLLNILRVVVAFGMGNRKCYDEIYIL